MAFIGKENVCKSISDTIQAMIEDESFPEEACAYLNDMFQVCQTETGEYDAAIIEWMIKAEKVVERVLLIENGMEDSADTLNRGFMKSVWTCNQGHDDFKAMQKMVGYLMDVKEDVTLDKEERER